MKVLCGLILGMLCGFQSSWSATIKGTVSDTLTKAKVESVLVTVKGTSTKAYTNAQGVFSLNTINGIHDPAIDPAGNDMAWSALTGKVTEVYSINGIQVKQAVAGTPSTFLADLPDGIYLVKVRHEGQLYISKVMKMAAQYQANPFTEISGKAAAAVTLVYTHKYYTTKEASANEGDTSVIAKLAMWWPDSTNTGVPPGTVLAPASGITISTAGTVYENKSVTGNIWVSADNVTIRKCKIYGGDWYVVNCFNGKNCLIEDCEIYSSGSYDGIGGSNMTVRRCNIHGFENGLVIGDNVMVEDCYIHDHFYEGDRHIDGMEIQSASNIIVRHNNIRLGYQMETGCVNITPWGGGKANDWTLRSNLFYGGTYSLYIRGDQSNGAINGVAVIGNVWVKNSYMYGTQSIMQASNITWLYNCLDDGTVVTYP